MQTSIPPPIHPLDRRAAYANMEAPVEDQARLLEDALAVVREQTRMMRRCLDTPGKLMDALKCWYVGLVSPQESCKQ